MSAWTRWQLATVLGAFHGLFLFWTGIGIYSYWSLRDPWDQMLSVGALVSSVAGVGFSLSILLKLGGDAPVRRIATVLGLFVLTCFIAVII